MNISFNVTNEIGAKYLAAVRWNIGRPDLTDEKIMNKYLKRCIASLIDEHARYLAIGKDETAVNTLKQQIAALEANNLSLQLKLMNAEDKLRDSAKLYSETAVPVDIPE